LTVNQQVHIDEDAQAAVQDYEEYWPPEDLIKSFYGLSQPQDIVFHLYEHKMVVVLAEDIFNQASYLSVPFEEHVQDSANQIDVDEFRIELYSIHDVLLVVLHTKINNPRPYRTEHQRPIEHVGDGEPLDKGVLGSGALDGLQVAHQDLPLLLPAEGDHDRRVEIEGVKTNVQEYMNGQFDQIEILVEGDSVAVRDGQADCDRGAHEQRVDFLAATVLLHIQRVRRHRQKFSYCE
jgi:hypothetical protein